MSCDSVIPNQCQTLFLQCREKKKEEGFRNTCGNGEQLFSVFLACGLHQVTLACILEAGEVVPEMRPQCIGQIRRTPLMN